MPFALHPALAPYVSALQGYRIEGCRPGTHIGVPSTDLSCVFDLTEALRITTGTGHSVQQDVLVAGLHTSPVQIHHDGHQHGVMLSLTPLGARALFGIPASALAGDATSLSDVIGPAADDLIDRMRSASGWSCLPILHDALLRRMPDTTPDNLGLAAWNTLQQNGFETIDRVATLSGWSERHLRSVVRAELGHTAGSLRRLLRFQRSFSGAQLGTLSDTAAAAGYADQAHLTREWRRYLGMTPTEYLTLEEFVPA